MTGLFEEPLPTAYDLRLLVHFDPYGGASVIHFDQPLEEGAEQTLFEIEVEAIGTAHPADHMGDPPDSGVWLWIGKMVYTVYDGEGDLDYQGKWVRVLDDDQFATSMQPHLTSLDI